MRNDQDGHHAAQTIQEFLKRYNELGRSGYSQESLGAVGEVVTGAAEAKIMSESEWFRDYGNIQAGDFLITTIEPVVTAENHAEFIVTMDGSDVRISSGGDEPRPLNPDTSTATFALDYRSEDEGWLITGITPLDTLDSPPGGADRT